MANALDWIYNENKTRKKPKAKIRIQDFDSNAVNYIQQIQPEYSCNDVATHFGVKKSTVYKWKSCGFIKCLRSRPLRFSAQQILDCKIRLNQRWQKGRRKNQTYIQ